MWMVRKTIVKRYADAVQKWFLYSNDNTLNHASSTRHEVVLTRVEAQKKQLNFAEYILREYRVERDCFLGTMEGKRVRDRQLS